jgi:hypothetical protein
MSAKITCSLSFDFTQLKKDGIYAVANFTRNNFLYLQLDLYIDIEAFTIFYLNSIVK